MVLSSKLKDELKVATENGDIETAKAIQTKLDGLKRTARKSSSRGGEFLQAWRKWNNTADDLVTVSWGIKKIVN